MFLCYDEYRLRQALQYTNGNITRAAEFLCVSKPYVMGLVKKFSLNDWARGLREASGVPRTGRPPRKKP